MSKIGISSDFFSEEAISEREENKLNLMTEQFARLLARENIYVVYGKFKTASFNSRTRVMKIPTWMDMNKAIKMRLRMHEIGHAIYTPISDVHAELVNRYGRTMASYINVVEDERVDRFMLRQFPGMVEYVDEANHHFYIAGIFGAKSQKEANAKNLIDRLNIASKIPKIMSFVPKNKQEADFYIRFKTTSTFEEALELSSEIFEYQRNLVENHEPPEQDEDVPDEDVPEDEDEQEEDPEDEDEDVPEDEQEEDPEEEDQDEDVPEDDFPEQDPYLESTIDECMKDYEDNLSSGEDNESLYISILSHENSNEIYKNITSSDEFLSRSNELIQKFKEDVMFIREYSEKYF
jgi:hypothetical protein